ncbi:hypothetical protein [Nonlabens xiamenensis]|uniref:hypothetical protein n=1 Tax=Nonlabens xiamenensis TaxID=2341043 RepID=UPI000F60987D|nr:hypothetical protein [Nonlabens xiamenensis]
MKQTLLILMLLCFSFSQSQKTYKSNKYRRTITVINDSILKFTEINGCFSNSNTLIYNKERDIFKVSGNPKVKQVGIFSLSTDLSGSELKITTDSLVIVKTGEIFYDKEYSEKKAKNGFSNFYLIIDSKITLVTFSNFEQVLTSINLEEYTLRELKKARIKRRYGIDENYKVLKLKRK